MKTLQIEIPEGFKIDSFDTKTGTVKFAAQPKDIKERVKSIDDAINVLGENDPDVIDYRKLFNAGISDHIFAQQQLVVIIKALNEGWTPDWHNNEWNKWFNWFNMTGSSSSGRFSFLSSGLWRSASGVGSRLCFKSRELAQYAAKQFIEIYKKAYVI